MRPAGTPPAAVAGKPTEVSGEGPARRREVGCGTRNAPAGRSRAPRPLGRLDSPLVRESEDPKGQETDDPARANPPRLAAPEVRRPRRLLPGLVRPSLHR